MNLLVRFIILIISISLLCSCSLSEKDTTNTPETVNPKNALKRKLAKIGTVATVNLEEKFVLIKVSEKALAKKHAVYYVERATRGAVLTPTGEQIQNFLAADITNGTVKKGDPVIVTLDFGENEDDKSNESPLTPLSSPSPYEEDTSPEEAPEEEPTPNTESELDLIEI